MQIATPALRALLNAIIFFAALIATAKLLSRTDPFGDVPEIREKWTWWRAHKDEFDTLLIGTSRIYRGVKPSVFDEITAAAGVPTHTFNFGIDGMVAPEDGYVVRQLLKSPPKNLRWVFIEVGGFNKEMHNYSAENVRTVYWHAWPETALTIRAVLGPPGKIFSLGKKARWLKWFASEKGKPSCATLASPNARVG